MKLAFAGTPEFAAVALDELVRAGFEISLVLTQPDRPAGRGLRLNPSAVKQRALDHRLTVLQPPDLKGAAIHATLREARIDALVVAAYGLILPAAVLSIPPLGCLNIHASLLPRWRGAAPIQRAILAGDEKTGITIMQMDKGLDTGPVLLKEPIAIAADDTAQSLHDKLAALGARAIVRALHERPPTQPQDAATATYAAKINKREASIDWTRDAIDICRQVRAFNPVPGAGTTWSGAALKIWRAMPLSSDAANPGRVVACDQNRIVVAAGRDAVAISELQKAGGKRLTAEQFLHGTTLAPGAQFGT